MRRLKLGKFNLTYPTQTLPPSYPSLYLHSLIIPFSLTTCQRLNSYLSSTYLCMKRLKLTANFSLWKKGLQLIINVHHAMYSIMQGRMC